MPILKLWRRRSTLWSPISIGSSENSLCSPPQRSHSSKSQSTPAFEASYGWEEVWLQSPNSNAILDLPHFFRSDRFSARPGSISRKSPMNSGLPGLIRPFASFGCRAKAFECFGIKLIPTQKIEILIFL